MEEIPHLLYHSLLDALKALPFLFAAYLFIEYSEHRASERFLFSLVKVGRLGPLIGSAAGLAPQCGFAASATRLYTGKLISFGTLAAVFIATSDEALPVLFASPAHFRQTLVLIALKFAVAALAGFAVDMFSRKRDAGAESAAHEEHAHIHAGCGDKCCEHGILRPAVKHSLQSLLFIFLTLLVFETIMHFVGEDAVSSVFLSGSPAQPVIAALIGLIPGCAPSILLSQAYISGAVSLAALFSGLVTNTGIGLVFLFRSNKNLKQNLLFTAALLILGTVFGILLQSIPFFV